MINDKKVLGIIPARGGSKGIHRKNLVILHGKPLIAWTIQQARASKYLDAVIVSTDDDEIEKVSLSCGAQCLQRPAELATDASPTLDTVKHAIDNLPDFDYVVLLEPTSPLRADGDIDRMIECLDKNEDRADSIISLGLVKDHPTISKRIIGGYVHWYDLSDKPSTLRRQDFPAVYFPYGVAYIAKVSALLDEQTFYTQRCIPYLVQRYQCYEIDDEFDLVSVEAVMRKKGWA